MPDLVLDGTGDPAGEIELGADDAACLARPACCTGTSQRRRPRASPRQRRRAPSPGPRGARTCPPRRGRGRRRRRCPHPRWTDRSSPRGPARPSGSSSTTPRPRPARRRPQAARRSSPPARTRRCGRAPGAASTSSRRRRGRCRRERAACRPVRRRRLSIPVKSQLRPASRRAESPAATSAVSTDEAKRTLSNPPSETSRASTSTRGWGSGAASASSSATKTFVAP